MEITIILAFLILAILILSIKNSTKFKKIYKNNTENIFIPLKGLKEDIEFVLRKAINDVKWGNKYKNIICLDYGMDEETKKICRLMSKDYNFINIEDCTYDKCLRI